MRTKKVLSVDELREKFVREALRKASFRWPPRAEALRNSRVSRKINPATGRLCWYVMCAGCHKYMLEREGELDHVIEAGSIKVKDIPGMRDNYDARALPIGEFVLRLLCEAGGFQVLCHECHSAKTATTRLARQGDSRVKGRRRETDVELAPVEGSERYDQSANLRGKEILSKRVAECPKCERTVPISFAEALICNECRRAFRPR